MIARSARLGLTSALSPNDRLQQLFHPWTSYAIVPLFALANAGIHIDGRFLSAAFTAPITLGILIGYLAGKPAGIVAASWLVTLRIWRKQWQRRPQPSAAACGLETVSNPL